MKYSDETIENIETIETIESIEKLEKEKEKEKKKKRVLIVIIILLLISLLWLLFRLGRLTDRYMGHIIETIVLSPDQKNDLPIDLCGRVFYSDGTPVEGYDIELQTNARYDITDGHGDFYFANVGYGVHQLILREEDGSEKVVANLSLERRSEINEEDPLFTLCEDGTWRFLVPTETLVVEFDVVLNKKEDLLSVIPESMCALLEESWAYTYFGNAQASSVGPILTPHGTLMMPDGTIHFHLGGVRLPDGTMVNAEGSITKNGEQKKKSALPDGYKMDSRNLTISLPDGTKVYLKDRKSDLPDGIKADGQTAIVTYRDGTIVDNDNAIIITPDGYVIDEEGNITGPDDRPYVGNKLPDGTRINGDGTITTPDGSIIKKPKEHHGYIIDDGSTGWPGRPIGGEGTPGEPGGTPDDGTGNYGPVGTIPGTQGRPGTDTPNVPGNGPETPGTVPAFPGGDTPEIPGGGPDRPHKDYPDDSDDDDPEEPTKRDPEKPGETDPTKPSETDPTKPGETDPTKPGETDPTKPGETDPTKPSETDPTKPGETDPTKPSETDPTNPSETDPTKPSETDPQLQGLDVVDKEKGIVWRQLTTIDLFKYNEGRLIYPGASAFYEFYIRNDVDSPVKYKMSITEAKHELGAVPFEYRLQDGEGNYIAGTSSAENGWLTAEDLENEWVTIQEKGNHHYVLEWRWPYERGDGTIEISGNDEKDTILGNANGNNLEHYIYVTIHAESVQ